MAEGQRSNQAVVPQARAALDAFRNEIASELGISAPSGYYGDIPSRQCGAIGGHMVRRMIQMAEQSLASNLGGGSERAQMTGTAQRTTR